MTDSGHNNKKKKKRGDDVPEDFISVASAGLKKDQDYEEWTCPACKAHFPTYEMLKQHFSNNH